MRSHRDFTAVRLATALIPAILLACSDATAPYFGTDPATETFAAGLGVDLTQMIKKSDALYVQDIVVGTGTEALVGSQLSVIYTGWLVNGAQFDSNVGK